MVQQISADHHWQPQITTTISEISASGTSTLQHTGGKLRKVEFWKSLAEIFPPDDIVWIVDAWDTTLQRGPKYAAMLYTRFEKYHGVRGLVVAGAETNCQLTRHFALNGTDHDCQMSFTLQCHCQSITESEARSPSQIMKWANLLHSLYAFAPV